jgi:predicted glutamine amidotransferase
MHSTMGAETTNGDGFGVGWYGHRDTPGVFRSTEPAWTDGNLRDTRVVVSEPLGDLRGAWREVPESARVVIRGGTEQILAFSPVAPRAAA